MNDEQLAQQLLSEFDKSIENSRENVEIEDNDDDESNRDPSGLFILIYVWIEGLRSGSRLAWIPSEECVYYSNAISKKHNAVAYTCHQKGCHERIFIRDDGTALREKRTANHNHGSHYNVYKERMLYKFMKERCQTAPASAMIYDIYQEAVKL